MNDQENQITADDTLTTADAAALTSTDVQSLSTADVAALSTQEVAALAVEPVAPAPAPAAPAAPVKQEAPKVEPKKSPAPAPAAPAAKAAADKAPAAKEQEFSLTVKMAFNQIHEYLAAMAPRKPLSIEDGCRHQVSLLRAIQVIVNRSEDEFSGAFAKLLKLFEEHADGALADTHVFRFFENLPLSEDDRKAFQRLVNMIKVTAPVKGRELALKQLDLARSLEHGVLEQGKQRVLAFFNK